MMREGKSWCWMWSGDIFSLKEGLWIPILKTWWRGWGQHNEVVVVLYILRKREVFTWCSLSAAAVCAGVGVGWPLRRESCLSASVLGESPGLLRGNIESWHSPAVSVVFQPKLCTGDDLHGASPALGVRAVAAACHRRWASPACWDFSREASIGWDHGKLFVRLAKIFQGYWRN